jgi:hypothetical protein
MIYLNQILISFCLNIQSFFPPLFLYYQITSHAVLLRRDVFDQIGYYDGNMKVFGDREFMLRFASSGFIAKRILMCGVIL